MESIGKFFRPAQGDAVTAIDLVGGDSQTLFDDSSQPVDGKEAVVDIPLHRRLEVTHDDPELQRLVEDRLAHRAGGQSWSSTSRSLRAKASG